jgi:ADP-ribosylglycohydrolase
MLRAPTWLRLGVKVHRAEGFLMCSLFRKTGLKEPVFYWFAVPAQASGVMVPASRTVTEAEIASAAYAGGKMLDPTGRYYNIFMGCILGGAFGDAMGFPVEFMGLPEIVEHYGPHGMVTPELGPNGKMVVSDDTQLMLFTLDGLITGMQRARRRGTDARAEVYLDRAYLDWYATQNSRLYYPAPFTSIYSDSRLRAQRAPDRTCLAALTLQFTNTANLRDTFDTRSRGTLTRPINDSKNCGAVMRSAPIGFMLNEFNYNLQAESTAAVGAVGAAITHGNPMGWLPAALLSEIIHRMTYRKPADPTLDRLMFNALYQVEREFPGVKEMPEFLALMEKAIRQGMDRSIKPRDALALLGKGTTGESALAIAVYLSLRYQNDCYTAIHGAVNQNGASDTIGMLTGNILGAWLGFEAISGQLDRIFGVDGFLERHLEMFDLMTDAVQRAWHTAILESG